MRKTNTSALHFINEVAGKSRLYIIFLLLVQMVLGISSVFYALLQFIEILFVENLQILDLKQVNMDDFCSIFDNLESYVKAIHSHTIYPFRVVVIVWAWIFAE